MERGSLPQPTTAYHSLPQPTAAYRSLPQPTETLPAALKSGRWFGYLSLRKWAEVGTCTEPTRSVSRAGSQIDVRYSESDLAIHLLPTFWLPTRGFTAAVSVF